MKVWMTLAAVLVACGAVAAVGLQDEMVVKPQKEHEWLKQFEGSWETTAQLYMEPGKDPVTSKGTETATMTCGGLWLVFDYKGEMMGQPFLGHGVMGYDPGSKKFNGVWVDSWITRMMVLEGGADEKGKVFTFKAEMAGPDGKMVPVTETHEIVDKDTKTMTMTTAGEGGKEVTLIKIEYKRKK